MSSDISADVSPDISSDVSPDIPSGASPDMSSDVSEDASLTKKWGLIIEILQINIDAFLSELNSIKSPV